MQITFNKALLIPFIAVQMFSYSSVATQARVIVKEKIKYYNVSGSTGAEIYQSMEKKGPIHGGDKKEVLASTTFNFDVKNVKQKIEGKRCIIEDVDIVVSVGYTYPRWSGSSKASAETKAAWKAFSKYAVIHEKEHVRITKEFAESYRQTLLKSRRSAASDCNRRSLSETFRTNSVVRRHERLHRAFDRRDLGKRGKGYQVLRNLVFAR